MKLLLRILSLALILTGVTLLFEQAAYAYADPGTGLLAIQAVGSALVAGGWYLRRKIYLLFHRNPPPKQEQQELSSLEDTEGSSLQ
jgi:O-antigen/teichoic acid export membrane protein